MLDVFCFGWYLCGLVLLYIIFKEFCFGKRLDILFFIFIDLFSLFIVIFFLVLLFDFCDELDDDESENLVLVFLLFLLVVLILLSFLVLLIILDFCFFGEVCGLELIEIFFFLKILFL